MESLEEEQHNELLLREELLLSQSAAGTVLEESFHHPLYLIDVYLTSSPGHGQNVADVWSENAEALLLSLAVNDRLCAALDLDAQTLQALAAQTPTTVERIKTMLTLGRLEMVGGDWRLIGGESLLRRIAGQIGAVREILEAEMSSCLLGNEQFFPQLPQVLQGFGLKRLILIAADANPVSGPSALRLRGPDGSEIPTALAAGGTSGLSRDSDPLMWSNERLESVRGQAEDAAPLVCRTSDASSPMGPIATRAAVAARDDVRFVIPETYFQCVGLAREASHVAGVISWMESMQSRRAAIEAERALLMAERLDALAYAMGKTSDEAALDQSWQELLRRRAAHAGDDGDVRAALTSARALAEGAAAYLASHVDSSNVEGTGLIVFNPSSWTRNEYMELTLGGEGYCIFQGGHEVPSQVIERRNGHLTLGFVVPVPALGYRLLEVRPAPQGGPASTPQETASFSFENDFYKAEIGERGGLRLHVDQEKLVETAGCLMVWKNGRLHDSREDVTALEVENQGPVLERWRIEGRLGGMAFRQQTTFYRRLPRIDLHTEVDFGRGLSFGTLPSGDLVDEDALALSLFLQSTPGKRLFADSPFYLGDAPGNRAVALGLAGLDSEEERGIALLNREPCAYRFDSEQELLRAILARPSSGQQFNGTGVCDCALLPFGSRRQATRAMLDYQFPCLGVFVTPHMGRLPPEGSFLSIEPEEALLSALFVHGGRMYVRLWNASPNDIEATVGSGDPLSLRRCSLGLVDEGAANRAIAVRPWGIQTLRLTGADEG